MEKEISEGSMEIDKQSIEKHLINTVDFAEYVNIISRLTCNYVIIISIKDTPGDKLSDDIINKIHEMGFCHFSKKLWMMYIGVIINGTVIVDKSGEKAEEPLNFSMDKPAVSVCSMSWRNGNRSEISINYVDYSLNKRGINIVVYDSQNNRLVDSVNFDAHEKSSGVFTRKISHIEMFADKNSQDRQSELRRKLFSKSIVLIGNNYEIRDFVKKWSEVVNIKSIMIMDKNEGNNYFDASNIPVEYYSKEKISSEDFIICCDESDDYLHKISNILINDGYYYGQNYIFLPLAEALLQYKKLIVFIGYCQLDVMRDILSRIDSVAAKYHLSYYRLNTDGTKNSYRFEEFAVKTQLCDILCCVPLFVSNGKTDIDYDKLAPENVIKYTFPHLAFRGLHPYKDTNLEKFNLLSIINGTRWFPFIYEESYLDKFILDDTLSNQEIYNIVTKPDFISEEEIQRNLKLGFKMIEISEQKTDCKILDYIKANLTEKMLYRDCLHYQNCMYFEIIRRMNRKINLCQEEEINAVERKCEAEGYHFIDFTEVPVLPCVAKALGIKYATEDHLYRLRNYDGTISLVTLKEWIFSYLDFTRSMYKIKKFFGLKE